MKKNFTNLTAGLVACLLSVSAFSQVTAPVITGENMLCPNTNSSLSTTENYDTYQWFKRLMGSQDVELLVGQTGPVLSINEADFSTYYVSVEVTLNGETETSDEVLIDSYVFASPSVSSSDFGTGPNGEFLLCEGETGHFELMMPYNTTIVWKRNNVAIAGQTAQTLDVTTAGTYTVSGAPEACPDFIQTVGVTLDVIVEDCTPAGLDELAGQVSVYPNPSNGSVTVSASAEIKAISVYNAAGQRVFNTAVMQVSKTLDLSVLEKGIYFLESTFDSGKSVQRITLR